MGDLHSQKTEPDAVRKFMQEEVHPLSDKILEMFAAENASSKAAVGALVMTLGAVVAASRVPDMEGYIARLMISVQMIADQTRADLLENEMKGGAQ